MSDTKTLSDLDFNSIWSANSEQDRNVRISLAVYNGSVTFVIFDSNQKGGPVYKTPPLSREMVLRLVYNLNSIKDAGPDTKVTASFTEFDPATKKTSVASSITFGVDAKENYFIGITAKSPYKFLIRSTLKMDSSSTNLTKRDLDKMALQALIDNMQTDAMFAKMMTSFKRDRPQGGPGGGNFRSGGNRGNFNSNRSEGGGSDYGRPAASVTEDYSF